MCNGTELNFNECQFPISDSNSTCSSIATVKCAQGIAINNAQYGINNIYYH